MVWLVVALTQPGTVTLLVPLIEYQHELRVFGVFTEKFIVSEVEDWFW